MMMMRIVVADTEHLLPIQSHGVHHPGFGKRIELPIHRGKPDGRPGISEPAMQFLRRNETLAPSQLLQQRILLPRMPRNTMLTHIHALS